MAEQQAQQQQSGHDYSGCPMGRAVARALGVDSFLDDFDWQFVSQDGLAVKDAWEMATTWASLLKEHVTVRGDHSHHHPVIEFEIAPNYEWVEFCLGCCEEDQGDARAMAARASSLVWRALASCRGYGHHEHALFWKRLFNQLQNFRHYGDTVCSEGWDQEWKQVADDHQFFENVTFPRFTLKLSGKSGPAVMDRMAHLFVGLLDSGDSQWSVETASQLTQILTNLAPLVQQDRPSVSRPVELALRFDMRQTDESRMNDLIDAIHAHHYQPATSERGSRRGAINVLVSQRFVVDCVALGSWSDTESIECHLTCGRHLRTPLATKVIFSSLHETLEDRASFRDFVQWALQVRVGSNSVLNASAGGGVRHLHFRHDDEKYGIPAICSALPHTQCLEMFQIASKYHYLYDIDRRVLAWLGLLFYDQEDSDAYGGSAILDMMAKGNNLLVALELADSDTMTDAYFTATLRAGAVIRAEPGEDKEAVEVVAKATQIDVCVTTTDVTQLNEWVFVVAKGYGDAWVRAGWIDEIVARPPGKPFLTWLKFDSCDFEARGLSNILETAGGALQYLDEDGYEYSPSLGEFALRIHQVCPQLESLTLPCTSGDFPNVQLPSRLRQLWVRFNPYLKPHELCLASSSFSHLHELVTLRLDTMRPPIVNDVHEFIAPLFRGLPQLQRFVWHDVKTHDSELDEIPLTYEMKRFITRDMLDGIQWGRDDIALYGDSALTTTFVALDSVVMDYSHRGTSAVGRLDRQLLVLIGGFLGTSTPRDLWVTGGRVRA